MKYTKTRPKIEPINIFFIEVIPNTLMILLSNHAIKVIKAIARITPGIA